MPKWSLNAAKQAAKEAKLRKAAKKAAMAEKIAVVRVRTEPHNSEVIVDPLWAQGSSEPVLSGRFGVPLPGDGRLYLGCPAVLHRQPGESDAALLARAEAEARWYSENTESED